MYASLSHLQMAIRTALQKGHLCRIYEESLVACWPHLPEDVRAEKIIQFATQNRWSVSLRPLGNLGIVAEFQKANEAADL